VPLQAVVFDFYGTLTPGRSGDAQRLARVEQAAALGVEVEAFDAELTATVHERFTGAGGSIAGSLRWVCTRLGARPSEEQVAHATQVRRAAERRFGEPRPGAVEVLQALRDRGLRVGLISDCSAELPEYFADLPVAPYIDAAVFSFVTGERKPHAANYLHCCARLGVEPVQCLYVGDGGSNELPGAGAVGMRAVHLAVEAESGGVVYGRHDAWDGETITALEQVLDLL
jgi:putative hydrolase of the HAD superfamily